jgi:hypothetical protein
VGAARRGWHERRQLVPEPADEPRDVGHLLAVGDDPYVELPVEAHNGDVQADVVGDDRDG